jgi:hypothetical protein
VTIEFHTGAGFRPMRFLGSGIAIVDREHTAHGYLMASCVVGEGLEAASIRWLEPGLDLPLVLECLHGVATVAMPFAVVGGNPRDLLTRRLQTAMVSLRERGIHVFVAAGSRPRNSLAEAGIAVGPIGSGEEFEIGPPEEGSSGACVRAAARCAVHGIRNLMMQRVS